MKVILLQDVKNLGNRGVIKEVKDGYAQNYLIPKKYGLEATPSNIKFYEIEKKNLERKENQKRDEAKSLAEKLSKASLTISRKTAEDDKLFGAVTSIDIQNALEDQEIIIDKRDVILDEPIKKLGVYDVPVKLCKDVTAKIKVWVVKGED